ncbi:low-density lipoprotein receptor-related protein 6-like [Argiope bruennichi]|uniref:low-density lipoprotein receptor-related protein 6-like n=1 Tax=Argiope bruennichi TaxID=94029 RepID=UPI0024956C44|nr:low-density lipoprotein receptor-related protein 6-like [Argiope bruennichi]
MGPQYCLLLLLLSIISINGLTQLLFSNRKDIRLIDAEPRRRNASRILIKDLEDVNFVDFYFEEQLIFWADVGLEEIRSMHISDPKTNRSIITTGLISPDGLAVDWMGKKLYWSDSETNRIEVSNLDGTYRKVLFWRDLDQPRSIALVPTDGWMFWTDWGETPKIEKASMDGNQTTRTAIVTSDISWPNGIAVDYDTKRLYWTDAKKKCITSVDFNGKNRQLITKDEIPHPFALTLHRDMLFWTDWSTKAVHGCNKLSGCMKRSTIGGYFTPMGIQVYNKERQPTGPTPCNKSNGNCSHLCLLSANEPFYSCACPTGVRLKPDSFNCENGPQELLLLVRRTDIRRISLDTPDFTDVVLELENIKHAIAVDYDPVMKQIYWTDDETRAIRRAQLNGSGQENLVTTEIHHPDGIAVDWVARNLYWTDTGTDRIEVARLNGTSRKILIAEGLLEPRAIVLDPPEGYMYWTDWGDSPKIEKAALDGSQRIVLISTGLGWPNGLSLDYQERKLYWGDAKTDKIEVSNLDGTDRRELVSDHLPHIFGFSLLGNYIYWTDWQRRSIERVDKVTGVIRDVIIDQLPDLMGLKAINVNTIHGTNPCAINNGNCSHLCLNRPGNNFTCACPIGLELTSDNVTCIVPEAFLIFSRKENIRRISLESYRGDTIPIQGVQEVTALDYDISDDRIYWTDVSTKTISRAYINGSSVESVIMFGLNYPEGMAVDWIAQNLYWADLGLNRIEVARLNGQHRRVILYHNMDDPRSLALDPAEGYLYWTDWGTNGRIERAALDGSYRKILIGKLGRPNSLTIDYNEQRLYWIDLDTKRIESSDLSGNQRMPLFGSSLHEPYSLTQYADYIYWADWTTHKIERAHKLSGENRTIIQENLDSVMDIQVYHTSRQSGWNPCAVNNGGCSHLCLALPVSVQHKAYTHHCECPTHYTLSSDSKGCLYPRNFMLFSQRGSISRFLVDSLDSPEVNLPIHGLKNIKAIDYDPVDRFVYWIDGKAKTIKKSHVDGSKVSTVVPNPSDGIHPYDIAVDPYSRVVFWSCSLHNTINVTTIRGSPIGSVIGDEDDKPRFIALHPTKGLLFWINMMHPPLIERANMDGHMRRILFSTNLERPTSLTVDVVDNYLYWGDSVLKKIERSSLSGTDRKVLLTDTLLHPVSLTILGKHMYWIDLDQQIIEMADKDTGALRQRVQRRIPVLINLLAVNYVDPDHYLNHPCAVKNGGCSHLCLVQENNKKRCSCPLHLVLSSDSTNCIDIPVCPPDKFRCLSGVTCLPEKWRCDGRADCDDMSDEMNCDVCKPQQFRCHNGDCIDSSLKCDGISQCKDESDELCCQKDKFLCTSSHKCINTFLLCDSKDDCLDGSDESPPACPAAPHEMPVHIFSKENIVLIGSVVAALAVVVFLFYIAKKTSLFKRKDATKDEDIRDEMLPTKPYNGTVSSINGSNHRGVAVSSFQSSSCAMSGISMSMPPSASSVYDRNHLTGASSSSSSRTYPLNPPPSPVTVRSQCIQGHCSFGPSGSYKHYRSRNKPPPPTPCSTDVCDDSEACSSYYYGSGLELGYDSDPFIPPPPTPRSPYLSDENYELLGCPQPPPPSPVPLTNL